MTEACVYRVLYFEAHNIIIYNNNIIDYIKSTNRLRQWFVCYLLYVFNCSFSLPMAHLHFAVVNECDRNVNVLYVFWAYYYILI